MTENNTGLMGRWETLEPILRDKAYRMIDDDPQALLEHDSWFNIDADVIFGRLYGLDGEIVEDGWRLRRIEPRLLLPIVPRLRMSDGATSPELTTRTATYVLQSGYAIMSVDAMNAPPDVPLRPDFTIKVLYLRYRRRL